MMQDLWNAPPVGIRTSKSAPCSPIKPLGRSRSESFHVAHKVPIGDSPYVKAKQVQLVDKDPDKAIALFWAAINAGDRVDSALKDMAIVMKQQNRAEEAIEAIKSLRNRCSDQAQESLDNILLDLYKRCGRLDDQIALLKHKLFLIQQGVAFNGKRTKTARSQGKKFQVSVEQEATRLLGNLGWALMQLENYVEAEAAYRKALSMASDNNKMCNLGICLMKQGRISEAKDTLRQVRPAMGDGPRGVDSHLKAFERAQEMLRDLESGIMNKDQDTFNQSQLFDAFLGSSSIWQPQPCIDTFVVPASTKPRDAFGDENQDVNRINRGPASDNKVPLPTMKKPAIPPGFSSVITASSKLHDGFGNENLDMNREDRRQPHDQQIPPLPLQRGSKCISRPLYSLNCDAPPFYSKLARDAIQTVLHDPLGSLKRTRSGNMAGPNKDQEAEKVEKPVLSENPSEVRPRRRSLSLDETTNKWLDVLPDTEEFDQALLAAIIAPFQENMTAVQTKRFKVFQDITPSLSPRA
ncbi:protein POLLENLESS 3-LIKE 2-like [Aristolochia californica]|uniref:protein POLLENLESS 3-LIKE 2-like n=1 Tax=Aristolochia californica TaxID=171875 RepID=UPI0035D892C4